MCETWSLRCASLAAVVAPICRADVGAGSLSPQIVVTGDGEARVTPDRATILVGVQSRAATAAAAGSGQCAPAAGDSRHAASAWDLGGDQLSTANYNVSPEMQYSPNGQTAAEGHRIHRHEHGSRRRAAARRVGAGDRRGAREGRERDLEPSVLSRRRPIRLAAPRWRRQLRTRATDAEVLARAAGGTLGPAARALDDRGSGSADAGDRDATRWQWPQAKTPIEAGQQTVSATVYGAVGVRCTR